MFLRRQCVIFGPWGRAFCHVLPLKYGYPRFPQNWSKWEHIWIFLCVLGDTWLCVQTQCIVVNCVEKR